MDFEQEKQTYNKGVKIGVAIGALSVVLVVLIAVGVILFTRIWNKPERQEFKLGYEVSDKMNLLLDYMDNRYLYDYDENELKEKIYAAMISALGDPYSRYYTSEEYGELMQSTNGFFYGIGVAAMSDPETGDICIIDVYDESPAMEAGIMPGDIVRAVDGVSTAGMEIDKAMEMMRGAEGTSVRLTLQRGDETYDAEMVRRAVDSRLVSSTMLDGDIGYILISHFSAVSYKQFVKEYEKLEESGMKSLIIDVRNNSGGLLNTVSDILDYLLPEGIVVYTVNKNGSRTEFTSDADAKLNVPCAVLANGASASASEVFCGAMRDFGAAKIIGTQTFGKGIVQSIIQLSDGSAVKITVEDYYTPNGDNIHGIGIAPDEAVEMKDEDVQNGIDTQLEAAIKYVTFRRV